MQSNSIENEKVLNPYISLIGAFSLALGTTLGFGSLVATGTTYLLQAGPVGSILGICLGAIVMLIIAKNYDFLMTRYPDCGGAYSFSKQAYGYDHAFITGWFLVSTYLAVLWANITSIPLFINFFIGNFFQIGFKYSILNCEVYLSEALISSITLILVCWFLSKYKKLSSGFMTTLVVTFVTIIIGCFLLVLKKHDGIHNLTPAYIPNINQMFQVAHIAFIAPLAFSCFESISHASEELKFSKAKIFNILSVTILTAALFYIIIFVLSTTAYPHQYSSWFEYISNLEKHNGIEKLPVFYVVNHFLGNYGLYALLLALFALIMTSLIGTIYALSRLFYRLAKDNIIPEVFSELDENHVPNKAIWLVAGLSVFVPLLGRTAIGWIVDVTAIGATLVYGFVCISVWKIAKESGNKKEKTYGILGLLFMIIFGVYLLCPNLISKGELSSQSYLLFTLWSILGMIYFRQLLKLDNNSNNARFGKSTIVWGLLFVIMLSTSLTWILTSTHNGTEKVIANLQQAKSFNTIDISIIENNVNYLYNQNIINIILFIIVIISSIAMLISNYSFIVQRTHKLEIDRKSLEKELEISKMIQSSVLPNNFPDRERFELFATMNPCKSVGGDYYDFFKVDANHEAIIIADVSGKGITAAMFMMNARAAIKEAVMSGQPLVESMEKANNELCDHNKAKMFITVFLAILDLNTGELRCINAGHNPPLLNRNGTWEFCKIKHSPALGVSKKIKFTEVSIKLEHQDSLFMYTDGVTEAKDVNDKLFGEERLNKFLAKQENKPKIILNNTLVELKTYAGEAPQSDDITMVMFKYL